MLFENHRAMSSSVSIALSKGRIFDETAPLLARAGVQPREIPQSRQLVIGTNLKDLRLISVRSSDHPPTAQHVPAATATRGH